MRITRLPLLVLLLIATQVCALEAQPPTSPARPVAKARALVDLPDHSWMDPVPAMRATYQSISPVPPRQNARLRISAPTGTGVRFTTDRDLFRPDHVDHGLSDGGLARAAIIRTVVSPREVVADIVKGSWRSSYGPNKWLLTDQTIAEFSAQCLRQVQHNGPVNRSYSGIVYGGGVLFNWGGAHGTHPGNDIDLYHIAENRWEHQAPPQCPPWPEVNWLGTGTYTNDIAPARDLPNFKSPDGEPYTMHSYQNFVYDPPRHRFVWVSGGGTWAYSLATRRLDRLAGPGMAKPSPVSMSGIGLGYDPTSDRILAWLGGPGTGSGFSQRGLYALDPAAGDTWSLVTTATPPLHGRQIFVGYDPDSGRHGVFFWPTSSSDIPIEFWMHHVPTNRWTRVDSLPADLRDYVRIPMMDYDSTNNRWIFFQGRKSGVSTHRLWAWDPATDVWEALGPGKVGDLGSRIGGSDRAEFKYDSVNNVFWLLAGRSTYCGRSGARCGGLMDTYAYRYKKAPAVSTDR